MSKQPLQERVLTELAEMKAREVSCLRISEMTSLADYMIICCGTSNRHTRAIANHLTDVLKNELGVTPIGVEGMDTGEWILVDFGDVIVHVMLRETRDYYQLEKLWDPNWGAAAKAE